jgi:plastocyanin
MRAEIIRNNRRSMSLMRMPVPARAVAALALTGALAGCGHTIRVGAGRTLRVALSEYRITPDTVRAYAGTLTIRVRNLGTRTHNLAVSQGNTDEVVTPDLPPGATATVTVVLAPGQYMLRSRILDDQALGEWGTLDVVPVH